MLSPEKHFTFKFFLELFILLYVSEYFACVDMYHILVWCLQRSEERVGLPGTE